MKFLFNEKMNNKVFEQKLMELVGKLSGKDPVKIVYKSKYREHHDGALVTLYYDRRTEAHIGSWSKGSGWAYNFDGEGGVNYND